MIQHAENGTHQFCTHIMDLPEEIIEIILSYISTYDLLQNVGKISKWFHDFVASPRLHVHVIFDFQVRFYCFTLACLLFRYPVPVPNSKPDLNRKTVSYSDHHLNSGKNQFRSSVVKMDYLSLFRWWSVKWTIPWWDRFPDLIISLVCDSNHYLILYNCAAYNRGLWNKTGLTVLSFV